MISPIVSIPWVAAAGAAVASARLQSAGLVLLTIASE
jgi:hypothetical protein